MTPLYSDRMSELRDRLIGCAIGLARASMSHPKTENTDGTLLEALLISAISRDEEELTSCIRSVLAEKMLVAPGCAVCESPCGSTADYDMKALWNADPDVCAAKFWVLSALQGMAVQLHTADTEPSSSFSEFLVPAISLLAEDLEASELLPYAVKILKSIF